MIFGVLFSFLAAISFSVANLLEKRAVDQMPPISARRTGHMIRQLGSSRLWMVGFFLGVVAVVLTVIAYSLAPIVIVQTIVGAGLSLLVLGSRLYLHEPIGQREYVGLGLIIAAVTLISITLSSAENTGVIRSTTVVLVTSAVTAAVAGLAFGPTRRSGGGDASLQFGMISGLFYGIAALQAKGASNLLARYGLIHGAGRVIASPYPYLFVVASVIGLLIFQSGLQRCRIGVVGPIASIVASVYVVVVGMLVYHESLPHDHVQSTLRITGFALALGASWFFASSPATALVRADGDVH